MTPTETVLDKLQSVKRNGKGWTALCPSHDDKKASLSISESEDGRVLLNCFAGCSNDLVLEKIGLDFKDLFPSQNGHNSKAKIIETYDYSAETGELLFQVVRTDPKGFFQRRPDGKGGWINNLQNTQRVLYRLPELLKAENVHIAEGEKDVENLRSVGLTATTCAGGAGKWRPEYNEFLKNKNVIILPDNDGPGKDHAEQVAKSLLEIAKSIKIISLPNLPPKGDVSDYLETLDSRTTEEILENLNSLIDQTPEFQLSQSDSLSKFIHISQLPSIPVEEAVENCIPENSRVILGGPPESAKTMASLDLMISLSTGLPFLNHFNINRPRNVIFIDKESGPNRLGLRTRSLCQGKGIELENLKIWAASMNGIFLDRPEMIDDIKRAVDINEAETLVIDSLVRIHRQNPNEERAMADFFEKVDRLRDLLRLIIIIAHTRKPVQGVKDDSVFALRGSGDIGGWCDQAFLFEKVRNAFRVDCVKSRDGIRPDPFEFELKQVETGGLCLDYKGAVQSVLCKLEQNMSAIRSIINQGGEWKREKLVDLTKLGKKEVDRAIDELINSGEIERIRRGFYKMKSPERDMKRQEFSESL